MRIYLPGTLDDLTDDVRRTGRMTVPAGRAHAVTAPMRAGADPADRDALEQNEFDALLAAADDSLVRIGESPEVPWQRLVIVVDLAEDAVVPLPAGGAEGATDEEAEPESVVWIGQDIAQVDVVCVHVDEPSAAALIQDVLAGSDAAMEAIADADLLRYDGTELSEVPGRRNDE